MTTGERRTKTITLQKLDVPARTLPNGMWMNVLEVLNFYGLDARAIDVMTALATVIDATPVEKGGRLRPDGTVDRRDHIEGEPS